MKIILYLKELDYMKFYVLAALVALILIYSVFAFFDAETIFVLSEEDGLYEWLTVLFFLAASFINIDLFIKTRNLWFILFFVAFFFAAGEEISWGQRIFGFGTPETMMEKNIQGEFTLHNLEIFSRMSSEGDFKKGIMRLLEFNFLFKVGTIIYGMILPFLVFHFGFFQNITQKIKFPIPPITVGTFFLINWVVYRALHTSMPVHAIRAGEIMESQAAFVIFVIFVFHLLERRKIDYIGSDIKHSLEKFPSIKTVHVYQE